MLSKCANPDCSNRFLHLHEGKLFRWDGREILQHPHFKTDLSKPSRKLEFFWLCSDCCRWMTLVFRVGTGVTVRPLVRVQKAAS
jgi:hypothetical protein